MSILKPFLCANLQIRTKRTKIRTFGLFHPVFLPYLCTVFRKRGGVFLLFNPNQSKVWKISNLSKLSSTTDRLSLPIQLPVSVKLSSNSSNPTIRTFGTKKNSRLEFTFPIHVSNSRSIRVNSRSRR